MRLKSDTQPQGGILRQGFTAHMLSLLDKQRAFMLNGSPKILGGEGKISQHDLVACVNRLQAFLVLALETVRAEFPEQELLASFRVFDVVSKHSRTNATAEQLQMQQTQLKRLAQVFSLNAQLLQDQFQDVLPIALHEATAQRNATSLESWVSAINRVTKHKSTAERHPVQCLHRVIQAYSAWNGLTSSGIEQSFSLQDRMIPKERRLMGEATELDELQLMFDKPSRNSHEICKLAAKIWTQHFGVPRASATNRIDKGVPKKNRAADVESEAAFRKRRRRDVDMTVSSVARPTVEAVAAAGSEGLWTASMLREQTFQQSKQYECRVQSYLENASLACELDDDLLAAAQAFKDKQAKNEKERHVKEARAEKLLRPVARDVQGHPHWLEKAEWRLPACRLQAVGDPTFASNYVVVDPSAPPEEILWCAILKGGMIVNHDYFASQGSKGIAFDFMAATSVKRSVFMSAAFRRACPRLAGFVTYASGLPQARWSLLCSLEEFTDLTVKLAGPHLRQRKKYAVIAIVTVAEATASQEDNVFHKDSFANFACKMACVSKGMCGI